MLLVLLVLMAAGPYADFTVADGRVDELGATRDALVVAVDDLASEEARLQDPEALEEIARDELGLVRPGEIPFLVVNPQTEAPTHLGGGGAAAGAAGGAAGDAADQRPWWVRIVDGVRSLFGDG